MTEPTRVVIQGDAIAWLRANPAPEGASVFTSMPDVSEMSGMDLDAWRRWTVDTARLLIGWISSGCVAVFYQTDIRHRGAWIDKAHLVATAAEQEGATILFHKIACRKPPGTLGLGRPTYAHVVGVARAPMPITRPGPDVIADTGPMNWSRAMGATAARVACEFIRADTPTRVLVDPFCGRGTALAVANAVGLDAIGIELSAKRCRVARSLVIDERGVRSGSPRQHPPGDEDDGRESA
ncbi:MAG: hypothetical protein U0414_32710 [Polyangiaceae bacterium]